MKIKLSVLLVIATTFCINSIAQDEEQFGRIKGEVLNLNKKLYEFWKSNGPDTDYSGFYGAHNSNGSPVSSKDKGIIQQARHLWTFSKYYELIDQNDTVKHICDDLYRFIIENFRNPDNNEFYWMVDKTGSVTNNEHRLYSNSFAIYGLAQYSISFNNAEASNYALACFNAIDERTHDTVNGGFDQSGEPNWLTAGASKGTNTQIHLLEAFTTLFEATNNNLVKDRLNEMIDVITGKIILSGDYAHPEFESDWTPVGLPQISYGHDIETSWLLLDAARAVNRLSETDLTDNAIALGTNAIDEGYDMVNGGLFDSGIPGGDVSNSNKVWWVQAETLPGLFKLYEYTMETTYLDKLEETIKFIKENHLTNTGEWSWYANKAGYMANEWKASYHSMRACMFLIDWIDADPIAPKPGDTLTSFAGKYSFQSPAVRIFPNPVNVQLTIQSERIIENVKIYNLLGRIIIQYGSSHSNMLNIDTEPLPSGLYIIRVETAGSTCTRILKVR